MREYETMKTYGKTLNTWKHLVTIDLGWKKYDEYQPIQFEIAYTEYNANGEKIHKGSEDFSVKRMQDSLATYRIFTWDGEKYNKGGNRWFEEKTMVTIERKNRQKLLHIAKQWFPDSVLIEIR